MNGKQMHHWNDFYRANGGTEQNANELYGRFCDPNDPGHQKATKANGNPPSVAAFIDRAVNKFKRK